VAEQRNYTVSEAMNLAKNALEGVRLTVVGEVSEFNDKPGYKAAYFTICDGSASMPCLMWRDAYAASGVALRCGALVQLTGQFSAYVPKGRMQFTVRRLELAGEGRLRMLVAETARKLELEGLMRPERKRTLPAYPSKIAVVTSPRGKAIHDVLRTLRRRYPLAELLVAGVQVEGDGAVAAIVEGMRVAGEARPDVVLLVRGGGSYEDLMPFNAEEVARAVVACPVPVVTGIGHEPDTSIADMVSDLRASTPTAAAEAVAPSTEELDASLAREQRLLARALSHRVQALSHRVARVAERPAFRDPTALFASVAQTLDVARVRLDGAIPRRLERDHARVARARERLSAVGLRPVERQEAAVQRLYERFMETGTRTMDDSASAVALAAARLHDLSPLAILGRGFAVCYESDRATVVRSVGQVASGDDVVVRVGDGEVECTVTSTTAKEQR